MTQLLSYQDRCGRVLLCCSQREYSVRDGHLARPRNQLEGEKKEGTFQGRSCVYMLSYGEVMYFTLI